MLINNVAFTVIGVAPPDFFGIDPAAAVDVYLPMRAMLHFNPDASGRYDAKNDYWVEMMGRLGAGVSLAQAQAALAPPFAQWVASTATNDRERANLPVLRLEEGAGGLDSLRRRYAKPLYALMTMVGLILAIACANTANLLLARAAARRREIAVRLSIGAGRLRLIRQLLTESVLLALLSGAAGILIAMAGIRVLTRLVNGTPASAARILNTGPAFFTTMQIPLLLGRENDERDRPDSVPVAVVSDRFAKMYFGTANPIGRRIRLDGRAPRDLEVIGVAASARYGDGDGLKGDIPPVVYILYEQLTSVPVRQMTYAVRTEGNPLRYVDAVRETVRRADARVPVASVKTQDAEIEQMLSQEIVFARLCSAFAILALVIACVGLYGTMAYAVARRTIDIGIRMALGARRGRILWTVLRESCALTALGLAISMPIARWASGFVESFLFNVRPNDAGALAAAVAIVVTAGLVAGYGPAWRASRINPLVAIRQD